MPLKLCIRTACARLAQHEQDVIFIYPKDITKTDTETIQYITIKSTRKKRTGKNITYGLKIKDNII